MQNTLSKVKKRYVRVFAHEADVFRRHMTTFEKHPEMLLRSFSWLRVRIYLNNGEPFGGRGQNVYIYIYIPEDVQKIYIRNGFEFLSSLNSARHCKRIECVNSRLNTGEKLFVSRPKRVFIAIYSICHTCSNYISSRIKIFYSAAL